MPKEMELVFFQCKEEDPLLLKVVQSKENIYTVVFDPKGKLLA